MLRVLIRYTLYSSLYFSNQPIATFIITYNCLVEIELHCEIYHFTHERQALKLDSNQHSAISRSSTIELLSDRQGLLLEDKKPLERTPHFFEPEVGECVNASGQMAPLTCSTTQSLIGHRFLRPNCIHSSTAAYKSRL